MADSQPWFTHSAITATSSEGVRTRLGISSNHASFRVGVLRTHLLTALLAHSAAHHLGVRAHVAIRWDDSDGLRSRDEHRPTLVHEIGQVAQIPTEPGMMALRQSRRDARYRRALQRLDNRRLLTVRHGLACLDVDAVDRLMTARGVSPEALTASVPVNATTARSPAQGAVPLMRSDGWALWHLATVVDDIDQRTTLIVRGTDKRDATPVQVRLHWALVEGRLPPAHLFLPKVLGKGTVLPRVADLLDRGVRPSALRYFLTEPYLTRAQASAWPVGFSELVGRIRTDLPSYGDSLLDERRLDSVDRKLSATLDPAVAWQELSGHCPSAPTHVIGWITRHYPRPLAQQLRLCRALTGSAIDYEPPPGQAEEAWRWLDSWSRGAAKGPPPHPVRWVLIGQRDGPHVTKLLEVFPSWLVNHRLALARQELSRFNAALSRVSVRSRPSSSSDSNSGSPTVRPVTATRTGA